MNDFETVSVHDVETFQKEFEIKFSSQFTELFENGELRHEIAGILLLDYHKDYDELFESNKLSKKTKVLIAMSVASAIYSPYSITAYYNEAKDYGWSKGQALEALRIAAAVQSGFTSVHAVEQINK